MCLSSHLKLIMLGMDGMLGKLFRTFSTSLGFFLTAYIIAISRITIATVTPIAIPTEKEGHEQRRQLINKKMKFTGYK